MRLEIPQHQLRISGNTAGATAPLSSGTVTLAGGNNITVSQAGNAITISGANIGGAQTGISGIANSETTYTSGTVSLSELGAITIRSTTGNQFQLSVNPQSVQPETQTFIAGISASDTLYTSGNVRFTGVGGGVTVSSNTGQRVDISVAAQSVQPETQTFVAGIRNSETTYTSGTVNLSVVAGNLTIRSTTGQAFQFSASQTVQTQGILSAGVSTGGNTAGNTQVSTGSRLVIVGSNGITASQGTAAGATTITLSGVTQSTQTQGILSAGVSTGGNTAGNTQVSTGSRLVFAGVGDISLSQSTAAGASTISISGSQSVQPETQTFVGGIRNSETTYTSGTVNLSVVAGNLTIRSTTGQAFQFSASQSVQPETQTAISGIANSQTTYTSGTVSLSELGAITIRSTTGNQFQFSVNSQTVQTQGILSAGASNIGNTAGDTQVSTGSRLVFAGGNNITVSQSTAAGATTLTISGPNVGGAQTGISGIANSETTYTSGSVTLSALGAVTIRSTTGQHFQISVNPETQTAISGIANSQTTYTSGTVSLSELGAITIRSTTGNQFQLSVNAQTVQTQGILNVALSDIGNTAGDTGINSGTRMVLAGGNNVTLSGSSAANATTVTISAANQTVQTQGVPNLGVSNIGNTAGDTGVNSGTRLVLAGGNNITLSQSTAANATTITVSAGAGGAYSAGMSTNGNTAGDTGFASQRLALIGGNNVTLSGSTNAGSMSITVSAFNQSVQPETQTFIGGIRNSETTYTSGTVNLSVVGGALTIRSTTGNAFQFSASQSVQPETQTAISGIANSQTTYTSGTVSLSELGAITIRSTTGNQFQFSVNAQSVQPETQTFIAGIANSQTTYTSGTVSLSELGAITVRSTTGNQYQLSVNAQTVQTQGILSAGASNLGNTAGNTTVNTGSRLVFVGTNMVSLSQTTGAGATTLSINATQSVQTQDVLSVGASNLGNTAGNTTVNTGSRLVLVGTNMVSLSQTTGAGATTLSFDATQSVQTQSIIRALYDGANSITTGTVRLTNANGVTFSVNGQTLSASVNDNVTMHAVSNTTQSTSGTVAKSAMSFAGAGIASVGITGNSVLISVPAGGGAGDGGVFGGVSTMGNTAGATGTVSTGNFVLVGTGPISLSQATGAAGSAATVSINAPATSSLSATGLVSISTNGSTISIGVPGITADYYNAYRNEDRIVGQVGQASLQMMPWPVFHPYQHDRVALGVHYTQATNSTLTVTLSAWFGLYTKNVSTLSLLSSSSGSFTINGSGTASSAQNSGNRMMTFPWTNTVSPNGYWLAAISRTTTAGNNATLSNLVMSQQASVYSGLMGVAVAASAQLSLGLGTYTATTSALPASIAFSQLTGSGTLAHRLPVVSFLSGTA